jgi:hypothetical protein
MVIKKVIHNVASDLTVYQQVVISKFCRRNRRYFDRIQTVLTWILRLAGKSERDQRRFPAFKNAGHYPYFLLMPTLITWPINYLDMEDQLNLFIEKTG